MKIITGTISLIGSALILGFLGYFFSGDTILDDDDLSLLVCFGLVILFASVIHYTLATRFWKSKNLSPAGSKKARS